MTAPVAERFLALRQTLTSPPVFGVAALVVGLETVVQWATAPVLGGHVAFVGLGIVLAAVLLGRSGRWAVALGLFLAVGGIAGLVDGVLAAGAGFAAATVGHHLWARSAPASSLTAREWYVRYVLLAVGAVAAFAATHALLLEVADRAAFSITVDRILLSNVVLAVAAAPAVRVGAARLDVDDWYERRRSPSRRSKALVLGVVLVWPVVGYATSYVLRAVAQAPPDALRLRLPDFAYSLLVAWGHQGEYAVALLGVAVLAVLAVTTGDHWPADVRSARPWRRLRGSAERDGAG